MSILVGLLSSIWPKAYLRARGANIHVSSVIKPLHSWSYLKHLKIERYCYIGSSARLYARGKIDILEGTIIGQNFTVFTSNHNYKSLSYVPYDNTAIEPKSVTIGKGVWIGDSCTLLPGTSIGNHSVVGACSVVRGFIPEGSIVIGNPAVIIKRIDNSILEYKNLALRNELFYLKFKQYMDFS